MTKIFVIDGLRKAGAQVVTTALCNSLARRGENIAVVTYREYEDLTLDPAVRHLRLKVFGLSRRSRMSEVERILYRVLGKLWCVIYSFHCSYVLKCALADLGYVQNIYLVSDASFSWFFRIRKHYRTTIIFHSVKSVQYRDHLINRIFGAWFLRICAKGNSLMAISKRIKSDLVSYAGIKDERIKLVRNFVDCARIMERANEMTEIQIAGSYFVFVGRISSEKRPLEILNAYREFAAQIRNPLKLVFVGDGPLKNPLKDKVAEFALSDLVVVAGKLQNPYPVIRNAAALVLNSVREGFPTVVMEASILGTSYICSRCFDELDDFACSPKDLSTFEVGHHDGLVAGFKHVHEGRIKPNILLRDLIEGAVNDY